MARQKTLWHQKVVTKIQWFDDETKGRMRFQFLGLPTEFRSPIWPRKQIKEYAKRVAIDIKYLETVAPDQELQTVKYPFTSWQLSEIQERLSHKLLPEIREAFFQGHTFRQAFDAWMVDQARDDLVADWRLDMLDYIDTPMNDISPIDIATSFKMIKEDWYNTVANDSEEVKKRLATGTIYFYQKNIKSIFEHATGNGKISNNPFTSGKNIIAKHFVKPPASGKKTFWTFEQVELMKIAARTWDIYARGIADGSIPAKGRKPAFGSMELLLMFGIFVGMRFEDLVNLKWSDFEYLDTKRCRLTYKMRKNKNKFDYDDKTVNHKYFVTIDDFATETSGLLEMLQAAHEINGNQEFVFATFKNTMLTESTLSRYFDRVVKDANQMILDLGLNDYLDEDIEPVDFIKEEEGTPHIMRHTMVARMISGSGSWDAARIRCGHTTVTTTIKSYGEMMGVAIKEALTLVRTFEKKQIKVALKRIRPQLRVVKSK